VCGGCVAVCLRYVLVWFIGVLGVDLGGWGGNCVVCFVLFPSVRD